MRFKRGQLYEEAKSMPQRTPECYLPERNPKRLRTLRDDQWERIKDSLPGREGSVGVTANDNRLFVDALLYRFRTGCPWRDIPEYFGDGKKIHKRYSRWCKSGVWQKVFYIISENSDTRYEMIDSTIVRAHQHSAGARKNEGDNNNNESVHNDDEKEREAIGRSRGGLSTKIHALGDALGDPTDFHLTGGQASDLDGSDVLIPKMKSDTLLGDKGYDADERVRDRLKTLEKKAVIPNKKNRKKPHNYDRGLYKFRHRIENFFAKLKQYRAIATRYEKTARNFLGAVYLVAVIILLK